jgi:FeS assembly SUF system regulator
MLRIGKLTDYAILLMTQLSRDARGGTHTARDLAAACHLPAPTVAKLLKELSQAGLLVSHRGMNGGYSLARRPDEISVAEVITALEGPIALTECASEKPGLCDLEARCPNRSPWRTITLAVRETLERLRLSQMVADPAPTPLERTP